MPLQAPRTETGVRLVLVSLTAGLLITALSAFFYASVASALSGDPSGSSFWHTVVLPGIGLALVGTLGSTGFAGFVIIERNRRGPGLPGRTWDRVRVAALLSIIAGAILVVSGIVLAFVYVAEFLILNAIRVAVWVILSASVGLFLFWTAERIDPAAKQLRQVALLLGGVAAGLPATTTAASLLGWMSGDSVEAGILGLTVSAAGTLSLIAWIVVYGGILGRTRSTRQPSSVSG